MNVREAIREFLGKPEPVGVDEFIRLLDALYKGAQLILSRDSFNKWVNQEDEVALWLEKRTRLDWYDKHVKGNPLGHFRVTVYGSEYEYVEVEWISTNSADSQKVFKVVENPQHTGAPLGDAISTLMLLFP